MTQPQIQLDDDPVVSLLHQINAKLAEAQELVDQLRAADLRVTLALSPAANSLKYLDVNVAIPRGLTLEEHMGRTAKIRAKMNTGYRG